MHFGRFTNSSLDGLLVCDEPGYPVVWPVIVEVVHDVDM